MTELERMKRLSQAFGIVVVCLFIAGNTSIKAQEKKTFTRVPAWVSYAFEVASAQSLAMFKEVRKTSLLPRSIQKGLVSNTDWTAGFFPGTLWYLSDYFSEDASWKERADQVTRLMRWVPVILIRRGLLCHGNRTKVVIGSFPSLSIT